MTTISTHERFYCELQPSWHAILDTKKKTLIIMDGDVVLFEKTPSSFFFDFKEYYEGFCEGSIYIKDNKSKRFISNPFSK